MVIGILGKVAHLDGITQAPGNRLTLRSFQVFEFGFELGRTFCGQVDGLFVWHGVLTCFAVLKKD